LYQKLTASAGHQTNENSKKGALSLELLAGHLESSSPMTNNTGGDARVQDDLNIKQ